MILYPAIDLKDGKCVRLLRGEMDKATVFSDSPANQAAVFEKSGFEWLHIVDLNGAFEGKPVNESAVKSVLERVKMPVQLGGGIRDIDMIATWLEAGVSRVILGTAALRTPILVKEACRRRCPILLPWIWRKNSRMSACARSSTPTSAVTARWQAPTSTKQ